MRSTALVDLPVPDIGDIEAFESLWAETSAIGATPAGGLHRLAASAEDGQVRDVFCRWLREHGFDMRIDAVGNIFGLLTLVPGAPYLICGSHLDSQPRGGRFDGAYGVVAGAIAVASAARHIRERGQTPALNLAVVNWTNEEGARFQPSLTGSSTFTGQISLDQAWQCRDAQGLTLRDALQRIGYLGETMFRLPIAGYVEIHVEQGVQLERGQLAIGVVRTTWAALKWRVRFDGEQNHTGPTPMPERRDALLAAARAIVAVREESARTDFRMHSSVGKMEIFPNSPNIVPSQATLWVEFRYPSLDLLAEVADRFQATLARIASETGTHVTIESRQLREPLELHRGLSDLAYAISEALGLAVTDSATVSGHDAISMRKAGPACLLFIPSEKGLAHNEGEYTRDADLLNGLRLLTALLYSGATDPSRHACA